METTPREIWYWLTAGALEKLRFIMAIPLDTPVSFWLQVAVAGVFWVVVGGLAAGLAAAVSYEPIQYGERRKSAGRAGFWQSVVLGLVAAFLLKFALIPLAGPEVARPLLWPAALIVGVAWFIWGRRDLARRAGRWYGARSAWSSSAGTRRSTRTRSPRS